MSDQIISQSDENDLRKLHSEVTQIVQQRFYLTTIAIVAFGTICGWTPSLLSKGGAFTPRLATLMVFLILATLGLLFAYCMFLLGQMRIITVYLRLAFESRWEEHWHQFRNVNQKIARGYSWAGAYIFLALGVLAQFFIGLLWAFGGSPGKRPYLNFAFQVMMLIAYEYFVFDSTRRRHKWIKEESVEEQWKLVLNGSVASSASKTPVGLTARRD